LSIGWQGAGAAQSEVGTHDDGTHVSAGTPHPSLSGRQASGAEQSEVGAEVGAHDAGAHVGGTHVAGGTAHP
jgi:hypothetical protein